MRRFAYLPWPSTWVLVAAGLVTMPGCADNAMVLKGQVAKFEQQQLALSRQNTQWQSRASALDRDNQELAGLLAQSRQEAGVLEEQLAAVRDQLRGVTAQLADAREEKKSSDNRVQALTASVRRQGGVSITPNSSLLQTLPAVNLPDVHVRRDGDVIRLALPGEQLFESGSARLRPGAAKIVTGAAHEILRIYPDQLVSVEGHTDSDPITGRGWRNNHELSVGRAMAVYDVLLSHTRYQPSQLHIVGHGPNHPVASNATPEGKNRNRRVELVVHPRKHGQPVAGSE